MSEINQLRICTDVLSNITGSNLNLARILAYIDEQELYLLGNYKNVTEYAKKEFSLSKSTVSKYISIIKRFGSEQGYSKDTRTGILAFDGLIKNDSKGFYSLNKEYKPYSYSKLYIMSFLDDKHLKMCSPEMSYRQINDIYINQKKKDRAKENKLLQDDFNISSDNNNWYSSKDVLTLFKISRMQIRAPDTDKIDQWFEDHFKGKKVEFTDDQKISIFSVLAMCHYMNFIKEGKTDETYNV